MVQRSGFQKLVPLLMGAIIVQISVISINTALFGQSLFQTNQSVRRQPTRDGSPWPASTKAETRDAIESQEHPLSMIEPSPQAEKNPSTIWVRESTHETKPEEPARLPVKQPPPIEQPRYQIVKAQKDLPYPYYWDISSVNPNLFDGVEARPYAAWPEDRRLPCFLENAPWNAETTQYTPTSTGLIFISPYKTGSTTATGIQLRMSRNLARQYRQDGMCQVRYRHNEVHRLVPQRQRDKSLLWTIVRDPTTRVVSQFFYELSENWYRPPSDDNFKAYLLSPHEDPTLIRNHYIGRFAAQKVNFTAEAVAQMDVPGTVQSIFENMDFVAVMERMDESLVAMSLLFNIDLGDLLYLKGNKVAGEFSRHARHDTCNYILKSFVSDGMKRFFASDLWQKMIYWDRVFHVVANRSLDLTIEKLGRDRFEAHLQKFKEAEQRAKELCVPHAKLPCDSGGRFHNDTDCLFLDAGCANDCLDQIAQEMGI